MQADRVPSLLLGISETLPKKPKGSGFAEALNQTREEVTLNVLYIVSRYIDQCKLLPDIGL
jgi:hypothetical protein